MLGNLQKTLQDLYLTYWNDYLTIEKMASDYNIPVSDIHQLIEIGKKIHNNHVQDMKELQAFTDNHIIIKHIK